ncbi:hypothetical protein GCM10027578_39760 [Spirosoma luteolum]
MSLSKLRVRYQTPRSMPAPYAYFYTLTARPASNDSLQVDLTLTYPDRDDIDEDELIAEGFSRDDDFTWSGKLPKIWLQTVEELVRKTTLHPLDEDALGEDDDFWELTLDSTDSVPQTGRPALKGKGNLNDWQYLMQELMQATFEAGNRERPFELIYLRLGAGAKDAEVYLSASFVDRTVSVTTIRDKRERMRGLPWTSLQEVMSAVFAQDFDPDDAHLSRPKGAGQWINIGTDEWYNVGNLTDLTTFLDKL